jgi:hypothetical protein
MVCRTIREKLSAYLDDIVSPEDKTRIEEHLKSCMKCSADLAGLRKTMEHVRDLGEIEPPPWMTQKIMARIRSEAQSKKGILRRLFYPLHIKLPIEAAATVLVIGLALYVYRDIQPEVKIAQAPAEKSAPLTELKEKEGTQREIRGRDVVSPPSPSLPKGGSMEEKDRPVPKRRAEQPSVSREADVKADKFTQSRVQEAGKRDEAKVPAPEKKYEQAPAMGAYAKDEARQAARAAAPEAKLSSMEKKKEEPLILTVFVKDPESAVREIEKMLKDLEGKTVRTESAEGKTVIPAEISAAKLREVIERLKAAGQVKERKIDFESMKGEVKVRIEIVEIPEGR